MGDTEISWTARPGTRGRTWNPTRGCFPISPGCGNCYACRTGARFTAKGQPYEGLVKLGKKKGDPPKWTGEGAFVAEKLTEPLRWRQPSTIFVDSMSDLFYEEFLFKQIAAVFGIMAASKWHVFQILTKRAARMAEWYEWIVDIARSRDMNPAHVCWEYACEMAPGLSSSVWHHEVFYAPQGERIDDMPWPLQNVWQGVSAENQECWDERVPILCDVHVELRFVSIEPLLGPIDVLPLANDGTMGGIGWVIVGCESGPGARECWISWVEKIIADAKSEDIKVFLKQLEDVGDALVVKAGAASSIKGKKGARGKSIIEAPYLHGVQYTEWPA